MSRLPEPVESTSTEIAAYLLENSGDKVFVMGPVVWREELTPPCYMMVSSGDELKEWHCDMIGLGFTAPDADACAAAVVAGLMKAGVVMHWCDDELYAAKLCETLWPGKRVSKVRKAIEVERVHRHEEPAGRQ